MLKRAIAILVLVVVAIIAIRLAVGIVVGFVSAILWILVVVALVLAVLWARSTLKSARKGRGEKRSEVAAPAPGAIAARQEDPVEVEMRRIREQLREQGRG
jgi:hypothetical protein